MSRRDIIISKFISGWPAIITIMFIISLFFIVGQELRPAQYSIAEVMDWAITTVALLALFSLAPWCPPLPRTLISALIWGYYGFARMLITIFRQVYSQFYTFSIQFENNLRFRDLYFYPPLYKQGGAFNQYCGMIIIASSLIIL